jgi:hypothetical protein
MSHVVLHGELLADGTLLLNARPELPPGPVEVTINPSIGPKKESTWAVLEKIWMERASLGIPSRTRAEIDAQIDSFRKEWEVERAPPNAFETEPPGE